MSQQALNTLLAPSNQITYAPASDPSPVSRELNLTGQLNPVIEEQQRAWHGRYLSGADDMTHMDENDNPLERQTHEEVYDAEDTDDVLGSGIFDPEDRPGTANTDTGVFTSHYSLPGYLAREVPFTTSQDVTDLTDDASIVSVPGGGMAYVEAHGKLVGPASLGPQPPPPHITPAAPTGRDQSYVSLTRHQPRGWDADSLLNFAETAQTARRMPGRPHNPSPQRLGVPGGDSGQSLGVPPTQHIPRQLHPNLTHHPSAQDTSGFGEPAFPYAPGSPSMYRPFPPAHPGRDPMWQVRQVPSRPQYGQVGVRPYPHRVPQQSYVFPRGAGIAMGQEPSEGKTLLAYAVAGVAVGAALKFLHGAMT